MNHGSRRGLIGLTEVARRPVTPIERMTFKRDEVTHQAAKQRGAGCICGIDNWWLESYCGLKVVTTSMAAATGHVDCMTCLVLSDYPVD